MCIFRMGILDSLKGMFGGEGVDPSGMLEQFGGLDGALDKLRESGLGEQVQSWIGSGANADVSPEQVQSALSGKGLEQVAEKMNTTPEDLSQKISEVVPQVTDTLSPDGVAPEGGFSNLQPNGCRFPDEDVDRVFHALADATRRDILRRSASGEPSVSQLARAYPMSFAAVQKHVAVLERAGLVEMEHRGRERLVRTHPAGVERARRALDQLEITWRGRVDRMTHLLATTEENPSRKGTDR